MDATAKLIPCHNGIKRLEGTTTRRMRHLNDATTFGDVARKHE